MALFFRFVICACLVFLPVYQPGTCADEHEGELILIRNPDGGIEISRTGPEHDREDLPAVLDGSATTVAVTTTGSETGTDIDCNLPENARADT